MTAASEPEKKEKDETAPVADAAAQRGPAAASAAAAAYAHASETAAGEEPLSPPGEAQAPSAAPAAPSGEAAGAAAESGKRIAQLESELATMRDQFLRALAEADNARKRADRDREDAGKYAIANFARDMLSVADNLRRALDAVPPGARADDAPLAALLDGVELTERQVQALFEKHGIVRVAPLNELFDANFHQAMMEVPGSGKPTGTVVQVLQAGYVINGRLLRPALVGVAKGEG